MVVRGSACRAAIWTSRRSNPGIQTGRDERVPEHVRMWPGDPHVRVLGEVPQAAGGGVPIHRALRLLSRIGPLARPATARSMARPTAGGSGTQDDLGALAAHPQHAVA